MIGPDPSKRWRGDYLPADYGGSPHQRGHQETDLDRRDEEIVRLKSLVRALLAAVEVLSQWRLGSEVSE